MLSRTLIIASLILTTIGAVANPPLRVGFYNVRNLYDTINDLAVDDADNIPSKTQYDTKINAVAKAIKLFNPTIIGLCEVEKREVVQDVANVIGGKVLHYDSKDRRGIDVAMIVDTAKIEIVGSEPVTVCYGVRDFLRADLKDKMSGAQFVVYVVHLPSQRGGARASDLRAKAHHFIDSLSKVDDNMIVCGDFNSTPVQWNNLYNTAIEPYRKGVGSYAYRDVWGMIDQILISFNLKTSITGNQNVVIDNSLLTTYGRYKGYPNRDISDHLPIYIDIKR